jgi:hypothetical protein
MGQLEEEGWIDSVVVPFEELIEEQRALLDGRSSTRYRVPLRQSLTGQRQSPAAVLRRLNRLGQP